MYYGKREALIGGLTTRSQSRKLVRYTNAPASFLCIIRSIIVANQMTGGDGGPARGLHACLQS